MRGQRDRPSWRTLSSAAASIVALALAGLIFPAPAGAGELPGERVELASADSLVLSATAAVVALFRSEGDAVWPGYDLARRSLLVYLPGRWAILVNAPHPVEGFVPYPEGWPPLGTPALLHTGPLGKLVGQLAFDLEVDGIKTVAVAPTAGLGGGRRAAIGLGFTFIVHEAFHQYQHDRFQSIAGDQPEEEYPTLDSENTALASVELLVLREAVQALAQADTALTRERAEEFLAVRRERWQRRPEEIPRFERPQEIMEGSAQYVQVRGVGLMGDLCQRSAALPASPAGCDVFAAATAELYLLSDMEGRLSEGVIDPVDMARNRVYPTGAALGVLLDFFHVPWKARVSDAAASPGLAEILDQSFPLDAARADDALVRVKERHRYEELRATCDRQAQAYPIEYQAGADSLRNAPGFHVAVESPVQNITRSRSCEGKRLVLEQPTRSFSRKCHVYTLRRLGKDDLFVEIRESAIVEETNAEGTARRVECVVPDLQTVELDGRSMDPGTGGSYSFERLTLAGSSFQVRYEGRGTLAVDGRRISVRLIPPAAPRVPGRR